MTETVAVCYGTDEQVKAAYPVKDGWDGDAADAVFAQDSRFVYVEFFQGDVLVADWHREERSEVAR